MPNILSPELQTKLQNWRAKAAAGTLSQDDMREAIILLREDRKSAAVSSEHARRAKAKKEVKSADDLLKDLEGL